MSFLSDKMRKLVTAFILTTVVGTGGVVIHESSVVSQEDIMNQFLNEKEGNKTIAYLDSAGIWTICRGLIKVNGKPVYKGQSLTAAQCDVLNRAEAKKSLDWVKANTKGLNPIQQVAVASFCHYNLGPSKCMRNANGTYTKFWSSIVSGNVVKACDHIPDWIRDGGRDCRIRSNGCFGQVERRNQERELCLTWMDGQ